MQLLPIGSVVKLKNSDQPLMITTRFPIANFNGKEGYFEYDSCLYPQGAYHNQHFFFNHEDIAEVCFRGYQTLAEAELVAQMNEQLANIKYHRFTMAELSSDNVK